MVAIVKGRSRAEEFGVFGQEVLFRDVAKCPLIRFYVKTMREAVTCLQRALMYVHLQWNSTRYTVE